MHATNKRVFFFLNSLKKMFFALNMYAFSYTNKHKCSAGLMNSYDASAYNFVPLILKGDHKYFIHFVVCTVFTLLTKSSLKIM